MPSSSTDATLLQRSLNEFLDDLGYPREKVDGHRGRLTRERIKVAKYFLGYGKHDRTDSVSSEFVRRLRHPRSRDFSNRRMLAAGAYRRRRRRASLPSARVERLRKECEKISKAGGPYLYGGGHGPLLSLLRSGAPMDCSASTSLALRRAGMYSGTRAQTSGLFMYWGEHGKGHEFTVWAHSGHVWIEFYGPYARFDTSPHGDGPNGPRMRHASRPYSGFEPRHLPGL